MCTGPGPQKRVERRSTATVVRRLFKSFPARVEELWAEARCQLLCPEVAMLNPNPSAEAYCQLLCPDWPCLTLVPKLRQAASSAALIEH